MGSGAVWSMKGTDSQDTPTHRFCLTHHNGACEMGISIITDERSLPTPLRVLLTLLHRGVAGRAERHPVRSIPEQSHVAPVSLDMVDHCSLGHSPFTFAVRAQRVMSKPAFTRLLPLVAVAALVCRRFCCSPGVGANYREALTLGAEPASQRLEPWHLVRPCVMD